MTVRYERVEPCEHGRFFCTTDGCIGVSRTILEPTEIRWCKTHNASVPPGSACLMAQWLACRANTIVSKQDCSVTALLVTGGSE